MTIPFLLYRNNTNGRTVEAVHYLADQSNLTYVRGFLDARAQTKSGWTDVFTCMGGPDYKTICFDYAPKSTIFVPPGNVVYVYTDDRTPSVLSPEMFSRYFTKEPAPVITAAPDTPKETPVTEPTEYDVHRESVLDALAVLRTSTTDFNFDVATDELMSLLADAFNNGWSTGIKHAQVNPYVDWAS